MTMEKEERKKKRDAYVEIKAALTAIRDNTESKAIFDMSEVALEHLEQFEPQQWYDEEDEEEASATYRRQRGSTQYDEQEIIKEEQRIAQYYGEKYGN